jgi:hypothetical protein
MYRTSTVRVMYLIVYSYELRYGIYGRGAEETEGRHIVDRDRVCGAMEVAHVAACTRSVVSLC